MKISVIVPTYNEELTIEKLLKTVEPLSGNCELLFVDGGSTDRTLEIIGQRYPVIHSEKGRAKQMNAGAKNSTGDVLFFLHCDSEIPSTALEEISEVMSKFRVGCFGIAFHSRNFFMWACRWISNHRAKIRRIIFGDQGLFIERDLFFKLGMFPDIPIMEDYQFSLDLKKTGIRTGMTRNRIYTSDRRFEGSTMKKIRVVLKMSHLRAAYRKGIDIEKISEQYADIR